MTSNLSLVKKFFCDVPTFDLSSSFLPYSTIAAAHSFFFIMFDYSWLLTKFSAWMMEFNASIVGLTVFFTAWIIVLALVFSFSVLLRLLYLLGVRSPTTSVACGANSYTFSSGSVIIFGHSTVSNYIRISFSLSLPYSFRLTWIAWLSQTLVWLVRPHPLSPSFSCQSCDMCCEFVCVVVSRAVKPTGTNISVGDISHPE